MSKRLSSYITTGKMLKIAMNLTGLGPFSVSDFSPAPDTINTYEVIFLNEEGDGLPRRGSAFIGIDTPISPDSVVLKWDNGDALLTWKAPSEGVHGGYVNPDDLTYNVVLFKNNINSGTHLGVMGTKFHDTSFNDDDNQSFVQYAVFAVSKTGVSAGTRSNGRAFGKPYELPYSESFTGQNSYPSMMPWYSISNDTSDCRWGFNSTAWLPTYESQDGDNGMVLFIPGTKGSNFISGPIISLGNTHKPVLRFWSNACGNEAKLQISVEGGNFDDLYSIPSTQQAEWKLNSIDLSAYKGKRIQFALLGTNNGSANQIGVDNITISEQFAKDLSLTGLYAPESSMAGDSAHLVVKITNEGSQAVARAHLLVSVNDREQCEYNIPEMAVFSEKTLSVYVPTSVSDTMAVVKVEISCDSDMLISNNIAIDTLSLVSSPWPAPEHLVVNGGVLTWRQPQLSGAAKSITEDFEKFETWSIGGVNTNNGLPEGRLGYMKLYDADGARTIAWEGFSDQPHAFEPMAFTIGRDKDSGYLSYYGFYAHSGKQVLLSWANAGFTGKSVDNWLILPRLSSNKKMDFYAKSMIADDDNELEKFQIMVSTTDDKISDFKVWSDTISVPTNGGASGADALNHYEYTLPTNANYVAIHHVGSSSALIIDDISYYPAYMAPEELNLEGYRIYRDGVLIAEVNSSVTSYSDNGTIEGEHNYFVTALYSVGESSNSNVVELASTTGMNVISSDQQSLSGYVYDLSGRLVKRNATDMRNLKKGVYIVNGQKIVVR